MNPYMTIEEVHSDTDYFFYNSRGLEYLRYTPTFFTADKMAKWHLYDSLDRLIGIVSYAATKIENIYDFSEWEKKGNWLAGLKYTFNDSSSLPAFTEEWKEEYLTVSEHSYRFY